MELAIGSACEKRGRLARQNDAQRFDSGSRWRKARDPNKVARLRITAGDE